MVARDAQTNLLPNFESSIRLEGESNNKNTELNKTYMLKIFRRTGWCGSLNRWGMNANWNRKQEKVDGHDEKVSVTTIQNNLAFLTLSLVQVSYSCLNIIRQSHILTKPVQYPLTVWWQPWLCSDNCHYVWCNQEWLRVKWQGRPFSTLWSSDLTSPCSASAVE